MGEKEKMTSIAWVLEADVFPDSHASMQEAVSENGHTVVLWSDDWWSTGRWPRLTEPRALFHGSLGNAARIRQELPWRPGAFCATERFRCSAWYPAAKPWLLHQSWILTTVAALVADAEAVLASIGSPESFFVRPDSPLKPFSGRVVSRNGLSMRALDHGFYYDDASLPVVVAPVRSVGREWRYVVCERQIVAGSAYSAAERAATPDDPAGAPWAFAAEIALTLPAPEPVFVMDICHPSDGLRLLELNPFSGADLYACDRRAVVRAVSQVALRVRPNLGEEDA
jgi:ATP-grasp domain-containing protein